MKVHICEPSGASVPAPGIWGEIGYVLVAFENGLFGPVAVLQQHVTGLFGCQ